jgi:hypothetical protein
MIESTKSEIKESVEQFEFPCLLESKLGDKIVFAIDSTVNGGVFSGFVIQVSENAPLSDSYQLGFYSMNWAMDQFHEYTGTVTLKNI